MRKKRHVNWIFVGLAIAAALFAIFGLPDLGALGWIGGVP
jgi:hypothetical protein